MEQIKITREEAMARFMLAKQRKQERVEQLKAILIADYERRTGEKPLRINIL